MIRIPLNTCLCCLLATTAARADAGNDCTHGHESAPPSDPKVVQHTAAALREATPTLVPLSQHQIYATAFEGPDGSQPDGWSRSGGTWSIQNGRYVQSSGVAADARSWVEVGSQSALTVEARAWLTSGGAIRLFWSHADVGGYYVEWDGPGNRIAVYENGALRRTIAFTLYPDQPFELRVEVQAARLYVYVNHHYWLDVGVSTVSNGKVGIGTRSAAARFDDFLVMDALFHDERPIFRLPYEAGQALIVGHVYTSVHRGIDFGWPTGAEDFHGPMPAASGGLVTHARLDNQSIITLLHANGYETRYVHADQFNVTLGQEVQAGESLGRIGRWGSSWDHVHFEIYRNGELLRPAVLSGYRYFCVYHTYSGGSCDEWYTSDNMAGIPVRAGVVRKGETSILPGFVHWRDDFTGWMIDQKMPLPAWSGLDTQQNPVPTVEDLFNRFTQGGFVCVNGFEESGWLRLPGSQQIAEWLRTREYYTTLSVRARVRFDDTAQVGTCPRANLELRFRESDDGGVSRDGNGKGYALVLDGHNNIVELRQANSFDRIGGLAASYTINAGVDFYLDVDMDDSRTPNLRVRVGLTEGGAEVVDWSIDDRQYPAGCIRMANQCAAQIAWDWIEVSGDAFDPNAPPPPGVASDFDLDSDVDQSDFGHLQNCYSGPGVPQNDPACFNARLDDDGDVDQEDFGIFQGCMTDPGVPADPECVP